MELKRNSQLEILPKIEKTKNEKKGRLLTAIVLAATLIPSVAFWLFTRLKDKKIPEILTAFQIEVPKVEVDFNKTNNLSPKLSQWAQKRLISLPGNWSIKIDFLEENFGWGVHENDQMIAASLMKLPVIAAFYRQVELGELNLDEIYTLKDGNRIGGSGSVQYKPTGTKFTLAELAGLALTQSDNTAYRILLDLTGEKVVENFISQWGMVETDLGENLTSASDMNLFLKKLYSDKIVGTTFREQMIADLKNSIFKNRIIAGVPEGIKVAHKIGSEVGVVSDSGIIFTPGKPFILTILSQNTDTIFAEEEYPKLVNEIYWLLQEG